MRIAALLYIIISVGANFFFGNLTTFVLAALSFPLLVWLLTRRTQRTDGRAPHHPEGKTASDFINGYSIP